MSVITLAQRTLQKTTELLNKLDFLPVLLARITVGFIFVYSGIGKLGHLDKVTEYFASLKIPAPAFNATLASLTELVCGALVLVGLCTRLAAVPLIITMLVALLTAFGDKFAEASGLVENINVLFGLAEFTYIALLVWIIFTGPGLLSLDRLLFGRWIAPEKAREDSARKPGEGRAPARGAHASP